MGAVNQSLRQQGFNLVELAIAMVIIAALLGSLLMPLAAQKDAQHIEATKKSLVQIKNALMGYALINGYLPCPDTDAGEGDGYENTCTGGGPYEGKVPWKDLGVDAKDAWGRPFYYTIDQSFVKNASPSFLTTNFATDSGNPLSITRDGQSMTLDSTGTKSSAFAVVLSSGKNSTLDSENSNNDNIYRADDFVAESFDDLAVWISTNVLAHHFVSAGKWP